MYAARRRRIYISFLFLSSFNFLVLSVFVLFFYSFGSVFVTLHHNFCVTQSVRSFSANKLWKKKKTTKRSKGTWRQIGNTHQYTQFKTIFHCQLDTLASKQRQHKAKGIFSLSLIYFLIFCLMFIGCLFITDAAAWKCSWCENKAKAICVMNAEKMMCISSRRINNFMTQQWCDYKIEI